MNNNNIIKQMNNNLEKIDILYNDDNNNNNNTNISSNNTTMSTTTDSDYTQIIILNSPHRIMEILNNSNNYSDNKFNNKQSIFDLIKKLKNIEIQK